MAYPYVPSTKPSSAETELRRSEDVLFWTRLKQVAVFSEPSLVTSLSMSPCAPFTIASTAGLRLSFFDTLLCEQTNVMTRFKKSVFGVKFRGDGQLVSLGGEEGKLRLYDCFSAGGTAKAALRSWKASSCAIHATAFGINGRWVYSMADDGELKQWDFSATSSTPLITIKAHEDASRVIVPSSTNEHILLTAGYDHMVKLWDVRVPPEEGATLKIDSQCAVEDALFLPREQVIAVASGPSVRIFDLSAGGRQLACVNQHHKAVTSLALVKGGENLLSASIDKRLNVLKTSDFSLIHCTSLPSPILAMDASTDDKHVAVGMSSLVALLTRQEPVKNEKYQGVGQRNVPVRKTVPKAIVEEKNEKKEELPLAKSTDEYKLSKEDALLRKFRHAAVITRIFQGKANKAKESADGTVGWMGVIVSRHSMARALAGQNTQTLCNISKFISRHLFKSNYFDTLYSVAVNLFEVASHSSSPQLAECLLKLKDAVNRELCIQRELAQTIGALEMLTCPLVNPATNAQSDDEDQLFGEPTYTTIPLDLLEDNKTEVSVS